MATLIDLSVLFLVIIVVGGLILMSEKGSFRYLFKKILKDREKEVSAKREGGLQHRRPTEAAILMEMAVEVSPPPPREKGQPLSGPAETWELPQGYGETRIVAMPRDPYWLFAYWEVSEATKAEIRNRFGPTAWEGSQPVLRVYDVGSVYFYDSCQVKEIMINDYADNWHIDTCEPGRTYFVELGRILPDGTYIFIARSNLVMMPRDRISEVVDSEWLLLVEYEKLFCESGGTPSSPEFIRRALVFHEQILAGEYVSSPLHWPQEEVSSPFKW